jgi:hypothetical protein
MSIPAFCAAILAMSLTLAGCSSFSTCQYTAFATVMMPDGTALPSEPLLSQFVGDLVKPLGFTTVSGSTPGYVSYSIGLKSSPSRQRVDVVVHDEKATIRIIDFIRTNTNPVSAFDQQVLDAIRQGVDRVYGVETNFQLGTEHLCFGP